MTMIDAHSHLGSCRVFDVETSIEDLVAAMDAHGVDVSLVQPYPGAKSASQVHNQIAQSAKEYSGRFFGIASINPHQDRQDYFSELSRCVNELGFIGVKMHTIGHALNPAGVDGTTVFESARDLNIPIMVHTGPGIPFAAPSSLTSQLQNFPDVKVVMAHAGHGIFSGEAIAVAQMFPQVYLEPSWCPFHAIAGMVDALGTHRVMMGSDLPPNIPVMLETIRSIGLNKTDQAMVLGGTAKEFFELDI